MSKRDQEKTDPSARMPRRIDPLANVPGSIIIKARQLRQVKKDLSLAEAVEEVRRNASRG